jgi:hypothetical protein
MAMRPTIFSRAGITCLIVLAAGCRAQPRSWPSEAADLVGQVVEVRVVRGLPGFAVGPAQDAAREVDIQRLRVRVIGSRGTAPGELVTMARVVAIDSVANRSASR